MELRNMNENKKTGKILLETGIFFIVLVLLCLFGIWQSVSQDFKITLGGMNFPQAFMKSGGGYQITYLNQESFYISFLSVIFSFLGNKEEIVPVINLILQMLGIVFYYYGAKKLFHRIFPLATVVIGSLLTICFYPVTADNSMHLVWFLSGFLFWTGTGCLLGKPIKRVLLGVLLGIFCYIDISGFILFITFTLLILMTKEVVVKGNRIPLIYFLYFLLGNINGYFVMFYLWNQFRFDFLVLEKWFQDKTAFWNSSDMINQYLSIVIIFGIVIIYYFITSSKKKSSEGVENSTEGAFSLEEVVENSLTIDIPTEEISQNSTEKDISIEEIPENTEEKDISIEEISDIAEETEQPKPIKFIENPLPLPKKHVKKEMNYAFEPTQEQMHYDLNNYQIDDDYDLKDI